MNDLINRYFDGELTEDEAAILRDAVAKDPEVDAELRTWERMLHVAGKTASGEPSAEFTDNVMKRVAPGRRRIVLGSTGPFGFNWNSKLAWAAALIVTFGMGAITAHFGGRAVSGGSVGPLTQAQSRPGQISPAAFSPDQSELRIVRLVYAPRDPSVETVYVAGTFNDWNTQDVSMERKGDLWTAVLILPRGTYEYMFVEDETNWVTDPLALQTRDDGFGRKNAVLDLAL
jgi:hypothetical protein